MTLGTLPWVAVSALTHQPIQETFYCADGVFVRRILVALKGTIIPQHYHVHDHNTLIARGRVRAWKSVKTHAELGQDEEPEMMLIGDFDADGNDMILIEAGRHHKFVTLTDGTKLCCLHNVHGEDAEQIIAEAPSLFKD